MRRIIIAGNWKMYKTINESIELANGLKRELLDAGICNLEVVVCPVFTALSEVSEVLIDTEIKLGAQDLYWAEEGPFTGEVSAKMIKDAGCQFVIIGHSERRAYFGETNETVNKKIKAALKHELTPIVCVGETLAQREADKTFAVLDEQLENSLKDLALEDLERLILAYEPVWAIGTGKTATPIQAQEAQKYIRNRIEKLYNKEIAEGLTIQYGGSVKPDNIAELIKQPDVDGALVGGASLEAGVFAEIVKKSSEVLK